MQMTIIFSVDRRYLAMMFNKKTYSLTDKEIIANFPEWYRKSDSYDDLKTQEDLTVDRIDLPQSEEAARLAGDHLYKYLSQGYICLGNYTGKPKPNMSHLGVLTVRRMSGVGFFIDTK